VPNATPRKLLVVRTLCDVCGKYRPCRCSTARRDGHALRAALDAADAQARAAQQHASAATSAQRRARQAPESPSTPEAAHG